MTTDPATPSGVEPAAPWSDPKPVRRTNLYGMGTARYATREEAYANGAKYAVDDPRTREQYEAEMRDQEYDARLGDGDRAEADQPAAPVSEARGTDQPSDETLKRIYDDALLTAPLVRGAPLGAQTSRAALRAVYEAGRAAGREERQP